MNLDDSTIRGLYRNDNYGDHDQQKVNMYIMNELSTIKQDNIKIQNDIALLRAENDRLNSILMAILNHPQMMSQLTQNQVINDSYNENLQLRNSSNAIAFRNSNTRPIPCVIFDLKQQGTVVMANLEFCELLGYANTSEVLKTSFRKFIHPDYIDRTTRILQSNKYPRIQFTQVYIKKNGDVIVTHDIHQILFGPNGAIVADIVNIHPSSRLERPDENDYSFLVQQPDGLMQEYLLDNSRVQDLSSGVLEEESVTNFSPLHSSSGFETFTDASPHSETANNMNPIETNINPIETNINPIDDEDFWIGEEGYFGNMHDEL